MKISQLDVLDTLSGDERLVVAKGGDNLSKVFVTEDPNLFNDTNYEGYKYVGNEARKKATDMTCFQICIFVAQSSE